MQTSVVEVDNYTDYGVYSSTSLLRGNDKGRALIIFLIHSKENHPLNANVFYPMFAK